MGADFTCKFLAMAWSAGKRKENGVVAGRPATPSRYFGSMV